MLILPRIDAPIVNLNIHLLDRRAGFDRGLTSSYSRAGYPRKFCCRRFTDLGSTHSVSPLRITLPRALPSTDVTLLHQ